MSIDKNCNRLRQSKANKFTKVIEVFATNKEWSLPNRNNYSKNNNNNILLRTHGPYHRHTSTKGGLLYIIAHYRNGVCTRPTLGGAKHFIATTAVSSFARAQKMDNHTAAHHTTGVSTCPTLRGAKHFRSTSHFSFLCLVCTQCPHIFTTQKQHWWDVNPKTTHEQLLHSVSTIQYNPQSNFEYNNQDLKILSPFLSVL